MARRLLIKDYERRQFIKGFARRQLIKDCARKTRREDNLLRISRTAGEGLRDKTAY